MRPAAAAVALLVSAGVGLAEGEIKVACVGDSYKALSGKPRMFSDKIRPDLHGAEVMAKTMAAVLKKDRRAGAAALPK
jgi:hypothetical protein